MIETPKASKVVDLVNDLPSPDPMDQDSARVFDLSCRGAT